VTRCAWLLIGLMVGQAPLRPSEVEVPGLGVKLKAGWRLLLENGCRYSVPATWSVSGDGTVASAANGSTLTVRFVPDLSRSSYKERVSRSRESAMVVHEDTDRRLWVEFSDDRWMEHDIVVNNSAGACVAVLEFREGTGNDEEIARIIADSIGFAPQRWPPSSR